MKTNNVLFLLFFLISFLGVNAQVLTQKQMEYEKNKVQIFTEKERDNVQLWHQKRLELMNLSDDTEEKYNNTLVFYLVKMARLDDKDMGNSKEEVLQKLDELLIRQDEEIKEILSEDEYKTHLDNYGKILKSIRTRIEETDYSIEN
jgi:hypothetical protein